jgi:hypothetical protein
VFTGTVNAGADIVGGGVAERHRRPLIGAHRRRPLRTTALGRGGAGTETGTTADQLTAFELKLSRLDKGTLAGHTDRRSTCPSNHVLDTP